MKLNTLLIDNYLKMKYKTYRSNVLKRATLRSFRLYDNSTLMPGMLYVMRASSFAYFDSSQSECAFLVIGAKIDSLDANYRSDSHIPDAIFLESDVDLITLTNQLNEIFELYDDWERKLDSCTPDHDGLQNMIDCSDHIMQGDIILADYRFNYVAFSKSWSHEISMIMSQNHGMIPDYIVDELLTDPAYMLVQNSRDIFEYPIHRHNSMVNAYCVNLFRPNEEEYRARILFVPHEYPATSAQICMLEFFCRKMNQLYNHLSDMSMPFISYHELRTAIRSGLEKEPVSESILASTLKYFGWNLHDRYLLLSFTPYFFDDVKEINGVTQIQIELMIPASCTIIYDKNIVAVVNLTQMGGDKKSSLTSNDLAPFLRDHLYKVGASAEFMDFTLLHQAYKESVIALQQGNRRNNMFWYYSFPDYSLYYIIENCQNDINGNNLLNPGLTKLIAYDKKHETSYVKALFQYMKCKYNVTHTADSLFIHRTTLLKHLAKIGEITQLDLEDWNTRLHLAISYQILYRL